MVGCFVSRSLVNSSPGHITCVGSTRLLSPSIMGVHVICLFSLAPWVFTSSTPFSARPRLGTGRMINAPSLICLENKTPGHLFGNHNEQQLQSHGFSVGTKLVGGSLLGKATSAASHSHANLCEELVHSPLGPKHFPRFSLQPICPYIISVPWSGLEVCPECSRCQGSGLRRGLGSTVKNMPFF